jgi:uncharacterized glyoxalase superfamily protein PhnB
MTTHDATVQALPQHHDYAPAGFHTLTPFIAVSGGSAAVDFYVAAFGAQVLSRMEGPEGSLMHAEILIGDSPLQLSDPIPDLGIVTPGQTRTGSFVLYVPDVDASYARAIAAGATSVSSVEDVFSGDRMAAVLCPSGHRWILLTRVEHLDNEEIERRAREWVAAGARHADPEG